MKVTDLDELIASKVRQMTFADYVQMLDMCGTGNIYWFSAKDQFALFAQDKNKTVTTVGTYDHWKKIGRGGKRGKAIGIYPKNPNSKWCDNAFDVEGTYGLDETKPKLWQISTDTLEDYARTHENVSFSEAVSGYIRPYAGRYAEKHAFYLSVEDYTHFLINCTAYVVQKRSGCSVNGIVKTELERIWNKIPEIGKMDFLESAHDFVQNCSKSILFEIGKHARTNGKERDGYGYDNDRGETRGSGKIQGNAERGSGDTASGRRDGILDSAQTGNKGTAAVRSGSDNRDSDGRGYAEGYGSTGERGEESGRNTGGHPAREDNRPPVGGDYRGDNQGAVRNHSGDAGAHREDSGDTGQPTEGIPGAEGENHRTDDSEGEDRRGGRLDQELPDAGAGETPGGGDSNPRSAAPVSGLGYSYEVGDHVNIQGTEFIIVEMNENYVHMQDPTLLYPIIRAENRATFEYLLQLSEQPQKQVAEPEFTSFHYNDDWIPNTGSDRQRCQNNIEALKVLQKLEKQSSQPDYHEQEILSHYVGWGGLSAVFDESRTEWSGMRDAIKNLLTEEEYKAARSSVTDAFYTPRTVTKAIHKALERFGFRHGNILEPSMGIGNFYSDMPEDMHRNSQLYGVELDPVSARISKYLHPSAQIQNTGLEKTDFSPNTFDCVIGNVPFGDYKVYDRKFKNQNFLIHDYFVAKSIDLCAPGGIVAVVTAKGTLDKKNSSVRRYLSERAKLLGAIRLPNNTFADSANTEATSDILFFQKKERPSLEENVEWLDVGLNEDGIAVNQYFINHPEMLCGTMAQDTERFGKNHAITYLAPLPDVSLEEQLQNALEQFPSNTYEIFQKEIKKDVSEAEITIPADPSVRNFTYTVFDGQLYYRENAEFKKTVLSKDSELRLRGLCKIRDSVHELIQLQVDGCTDEAFDLQREQLNQVYDAFVSKYGALNEKKNKELFHDDVDSSLLSSIEKNVDGNYIKQEMFRKRTIRPVVEHERVETALEALNITIGEKGFVDIDYMLKLYPVEFEQLKTELRGHLFLNPEKAQIENPYAGWESAEEYLTGEVREKLRTVQLYHEAEKNRTGNEQKYVDNVEFLTKVQPKDLEATEIEVRFGSTWVDIEDYRKFAIEILKIPSWGQRSIRFHFDEVSNKYTIEGKGTVSRNSRATKEYGTSRANALYIMERLLNLGEIKVYDEMTDLDGNKRRMVNQEETIKAQGKADALKQSFKEWIFKDYDRREHYVRLYNDRFNGIRTRTYDGSNMDFPGMNPSIELKDYQKNAVARVVRGGNTLLAHCVGAGKSFEMAAACMELKRLGLATKPLIVVPNNLVPQMTNEFLTLYPKANLLMATEKDFEKGSRRRFMGKIAAGEYDAVIMGHSQFGMLKLSPQRERQYVQEEIDEIMDAIQSTRDRWSIKAMQGTLKKMQERMHRLSDTGHKDDFLDFEELGVDALFMDEAHLYKNLQFNTKLSRVAGVNTSNSGRSYDLFMKIRYLNSLTPGRNIVFATGTPISNSMTEMYVMQKYLRPERLKEKGLYHFDAWAGTFGETVTAFEIKPAGDGFQEKTRFAKFVNLPELQNLYHEFADVQMPEMLDLPVPKLENDSYDIVECPKNYQIENKMAELVERARLIKDGRVDPSEDNMLKICSEAKKLSTDIRLLEPDAEPYEDGKLYRCVENIHKIWEETMEQKSIQIVFSDMGVPSGKKGDGKFCVYDFIRDELVKKGIPREEICFIQDAKTKLEKERLYEQLRNGEKRVIIGSTETMGTGTNIQQRAIAMHEIDVPWRPSDVEQREGRIIRQGNENERVRIFRYVTKDTFDAYNWSIIENKQKFISQVMTNKQVGRSCEDVDEAVLNYAEMKAAATGDPRIKELIDVSAEVRKLKVQRDAFMEDKFRLEKSLKEELPVRLEKCRNNLNAIETDMETRNGNPDYIRLNAQEEAQKGFCIQIGGETYTDKAKAGEKLVSILNKGIESGKKVRLGNFCGFEFGVEHTYDRNMYYLKGKGYEYTAEVSYSAAGTVVVLSNLIGRKIDKTHEDMLHQEADILDCIKNAEEMIKKEFPKEEEYLMAVEKQKKLEKELAGEDERMENKEEKLLYGDEPMYAIYQLKEGEELHYYRFTDYDSMGREGLAIEKRNYDCVYSAPFGECHSLDDIFEKFNTEHPQDFTGHSLSVSDVIAVNSAKDEDIKAFFVDRIGFKPLPGFMEEKSIQPGKEMEQENTMQMMRRRSRGGR